MLDENTNPPWWEANKEKVKMLLSFHFESKSQSCEAILSKLKFPWHMYSNTHLQ